MANRSTTANCCQQPVLQMQQQSTADSGKDQQADAAVVDLLRQLHQQADAAVADLQLQLHQQTDAAVADLQLQLHQKTEAAVADLLRQSKQQTDAAVVDLQRQLQQHSRTINALEAEKADWQSQLRTAAEESQERIQTLKQRIEQVFEEGPHGSVAEESSTEGVPAKIRRLNPPGRSGAIPTETDLKLANKHGSTMETLSLETLRCILSFCGLRTLVALRRVSKQFRALSDGVPKKWINLSDLFKPDVVDLRARIAAAVHYAGAGLVGFSDFTGTCNDSEYHLLCLPSLLSQSCPNLKALHLPNSCSEDYDNIKEILYQLCKYAASFPKLEEITVDSISPELVLALPALKRINGTVNGRFNKEVDVEALAWRLSGCQYIAFIETWLVSKITEHFCFEEVPLCPAIRGFRGDLDINHQPDPRQVDCVARMFPEAWFSGVEIDFEDYARSLSPIAHRIKSAVLFVDTSWTFDEAPSTFSNMVCLRDLRITGHLAEEYRDYFSFLTKLEQLENLSIFMEKVCAGWSCFLGMLAPSTLLRRLSIECASFPNDFHTHFKALAASGV